MSDMSVKSMDAKIDSESISRNKLCSLVGILSTSRETRDPNNLEHISIPVEKLTNVIWELHILINRENQRINQKFTQEQLAGYYSRNPQGITNENI